MTQEIAAANKELVRRFYEEVYVNWNMAMADEVISPQFTSHDWPEGGPTGPKAFRHYYSAIRSALADARLPRSVPIVRAERGRRCARLCAVCCSLRFARRRRGHL